MFARSPLCRLPGRFVVIVAALVVDSRPRDAIGVPAPRPMPPSVLLFIPKLPTRTATAHYRRYQINVLKSCDVAALRSLKAADLPSLKSRTDPAAWMRLNLKAEYLDGTGVLRIAFRAGSHREQALLVNAIAQAYLKIEVPRNRKLTEDLLNSYQEPLRSMQKVLDELTARPNDQMSKQRIAGIGNDIHNIESLIKRMEAELRTPPLLLELAEVPSD